MLPRWRLPGRRSPHDMQVRVYAGVAIIYQFWSVRQPTACAPGPCRAAKQNKTLVIIFVDYAA